jgi:hypothetical protein
MNHSKTIPTYMIPTGVPEHEVACVQTQGCQASSAVQEGIGPSDALKDSNLQVRVANSLSGTILSRFTALHNGLGKRNSRHCPS